MKSAVKNIIYFILLIGITGAFSYSLSLNYRTPDPSSHLFLIVVFFVLIILLITLLFYRNLLDRIVGSWYNSFSQGNIKLESFFISIGFFLYCFIFLLVPTFFGFQFSLNVSERTFILLIGSLLVSLAISVPLGTSIYFGKKWLSSPTPNKVFYKMPLSVILPTIIFSIILGIYIGVAFPGGHPPAIFIWPIYAMGYILGIALLSFILALYLRHYRVAQHKLVWKWILTIIALIPYVVGALGMMS